MHAKKLVLATFLALAFFPYSGTRAQDALAQATPIDDTVPATNLLNLFKLVCVETFPDANKARTLMAERGWPVDETKTGAGTTAWTANFNGEVQSIGLAEDGGSCAVGSMLVTLSTVDKLFQNYYAQELGATGLGDEPDGKGKLWITANTTILINDLSEQEQGIIISTAPILKTGLEASE